MTPVSSLRISSLAPGSTAPELSEKFGSLVAHIYSCDNGRAVAIEQSRSAADGLASRNHQLRGYRFLQRPHFDRRRQVHDGGSGGDARREIPGHGKVGPDAGDG